MEISPFLYKIFILILSTIVIIYFIPLNTQYSIQFSEGKRWTGTTLYAPFDFPIIKSSEELQIEKKLIESKSILYLDVNPGISELIVEDYSKNFNKFFEYKIDSIDYKNGLIFLNSYLKRGILPLNLSSFKTTQIALISNNVERLTLLDSLFKLENLSAELNKSLKNKSKRNEKKFYNLFFEILQPNLSYNKRLTEDYLNELNSAISLTRDLVLKGEVIIETNQINFDITFLLMTIK